MRESALAGPEGWIPVDAASCETRFTNVFAVGDVTAVPLGGQAWLPKQGVFAHGQADAVAQTIAARLRGEGSEGRFAGEGELFVETGGGVAGVVCGHFFARPRPRALVMPPTPHWHAARMAVAGHWWGTYFGH